MKIKVMPCGYPSYIITPRSPKIIPVVQVYYDYFHNNGRKPIAEEKYAFWRYIHRCSRLRGIDTRRDTRGTTSIDIPKEVEA